MQILPPDTSWFSIASGIVAAASSIATIIFSLIPALEMNRVGKRLEQVESIINREANVNRLNILESERLLMDSKIVAHQVYPVWKSGVSLVFCLFPFFYLLPSASEMEGWGIRIFVLVMTWGTSLVLIDTWVSSLFRNRVVSAFYFAGYALPRHKISRFARNLPLPFELLSVEALSALNLSFYFYNYLLMQWRGSEPLEAFVVALVLLVVNSGAGIAIYRALVSETESRAELLMTVSSNLHDDFNANTERM